MSVALFLAVVYRHQGRPQKALVLFVLFAAIAVIYQSANHLDRWYRLGTYRDDLSIADVLQRLPMTGKNLGRYLCYALVQPFLPMHCPCALQSGRTELKEQVWQGKIVWDATAVSCVVLVGIAAGLTLHGTTRLVRARGLLYFMLLGLGIAAWHVGLIVIGRLNLRPDSLTCNSHYTYMTLSLVMIASAVPLLGLDRKMSTWWAVRGSLLPLIAGLFSLSIISLDVTRRVNVQGASYFQPLRAVNGALAGFVRQHQREPDFRMAVVRGPHDPEHFILAALMFYHRYLDAARPTHLVALEDGHPTFVALARWRVGTSRRRARLLSRFGLHETRLLNLSRGRSLLRHSARSI